MPFPVADPTCSTHAAPDKYPAVLENDTAGVLEYRNEPSEKTTAQAPPDSVRTARSAFRRKLTFPDGKSVVREIKPGEVAWIPAQAPVGENIGDTDTHVILVELKQPCKK